MCADCFSNIAKTPDKMVNKQMEIRKTQGKMLIISMCIYMMKRIRVIIRCSLAVVVGIREKVAIW